MRFCLMRVVRMGLAMVAASVQVMHRNMAMRTAMRLHQAMARRRGRRRTTMVMLHHNGCYYLHHYLSISLRGSHCCQTGYCNNDM